MVKGVEMKKAFISIVLVIALASLTYGYYEKTQPFNPRLGTPKHPPTEITDRPADWWEVWWTGVGQFTDFVVSNVLENGIWFNCENEDYSGEFSFCAQDNYPALAGYTGEYPAGSEQYYVWDAGMWIGGLYPIIFAGDTTWEPRVATAAYYSDLNAMAAPEMSAVGMGGQIDHSGRGLFFSDMRIPTGYGYAHEWEHMFPQPGLGLEEWQVPWPFTDSTVNERRRTASPGSEVAPGDIISIQDTYACGGDWLPEEDATFLWVRGYDIAGLGVRIEQRTYSWNYDYNNAYIYLNYKIINVNDFPLRDLYVGYFMDNDVGSGISEEGQGATDDMIGFDRDLNLGYTFDSDAFEPQWKSSAGYVGCMMLETPGDVGMTGFNTWLYGDPIDDDAQDSLKYEALRNTQFKVWTIPRDVRQLASSGPRPLLRPWKDSGDEMSFTVAILVGTTLEELTGRAEFARTQFEAGYLGFSPPPSPEVSVQPGDGRAYITWDGTRSEGYTCAFSKENTFEGYRVYRSQTALPGEWKLLADYDIAGSATWDTVKVEQTKGASKLTTGFGGFYGRLPGDIPGPELNFGDGLYTINFTCPCEVETTFFGEDTIVDVKANYFKVYNQVTGELYSYNQAARTDAYGYSVVDPVSGTAYADSAYVSGSYVYIDSFYVLVENGEFDPEQPGSDLTPTPGDIITINTYKGKSVGAQIGLAYSYVDSGLVNGMTYYYSVTAYSREIPTWGVASLESGKTAKKFWVVPRRDAVNWTGPGVEVTSTKGGGDATIDVFVADPEAVTGEAYFITFVAEDPLTDDADYWRLWDEDSVLLLDNRPTVNGELNNPLVDGLSFSVETVKQTHVDTTNTKWSWTQDSPTYYFSAAINPRREAKADYELTMDVCTDINGLASPVCVYRMTGEMVVPGYFRYIDQAPFDTLSVEDQVLVLDTADIRTLVLTLTVKDSADIDTTLISTRPMPGDRYRIKMMKRTTTDDEYTILTTPLMSDKQSYELDEVRVVPNPYYIRAPWDRSRYEQQVWFQGLPSQCTIRIFNAAGLLIRTIRHDATGAGAGAHAWDLLNEDKQNVVSGLYIYQVTAPEGKENVGKFAIIR
ncbi:hypothetical protein AMJ40_05170 [candidate division TA06 bacterium DG_26]|uniref:Uncharacterized protein n=1 Tax=candidate division TA06 bacterium DG_26 TaxID=1703771 RepID=A0A0S7WHE8_UNCT6|nr:MAG: hypothetical protein AMJ40_05170 [candidate division TA06 bacterium DG_26]